MTRDFVRKTCEEHNWKLFEVFTEAKYEDLVLERGGFPSGPKSHNSMLWYLKQKPLRAFLQTQKVKYHDRIGLVSGIRAQESTRRMGAGMSVAVSRWKIQLWLNPILDWSKKDCNRYMAKHKLKRNPVVDLLHRSGECLCGALAYREELKDIKLWFPETYQHIHKLEHKAKEEGLEDYLWAARSDRKDHAKRFFEESDFAEPLCQSCIYG